MIDTVKRGSGNAKLSLLILALLHNFIKHYLGSIEYNVFHLNMTVIYMYCTKNYNFFLLLEFSGVKILNVQIHYYRIVNTVLKKSRNSERICSKAYIEHTFRNDFTIGD